MYTSLSTSIRSSVPKYHKVQFKVDTYLCVYIRFTVGWLIIGPTDHKCFLNYFLFDLLWNKYISNFTLLTLMQLAICKVTSN